MQSPATQGRDRRETLLIAGLVAVALMQVVVVALGAHDLLARDPFGLCPPVDVQAVAPDRRAKL